MGDFVWQGKKLGHSTYGAIFEPCDGTQACFPFWRKKRLTSKLDCSKFDLIPLCQVQSDEEKMSATNIEKDLNN